MSTGNFNVKNLEKDMRRHLDFIAVPEIRKFTEKALELYGSEEKLQEANRAADILIDLLKRKKLLDEHTHQSFVDILLSAMLLHNLFYDENDWTTLFYARRDLCRLARECGINKQISSLIFSTIEGQLGEDTPVDECIPKPNTPGELFAYAVWFAKKYNNSILRSP